MEEYDFVVVGSGIFGATIAERLTNAGKKVLVIERRSHIAGNIYSEYDEETGIEVHKYGSHIFHTEHEDVWEYLNRFTDFNDYIHTVDTRHDGMLYPMPINLDTINRLYGLNMNAKEAEEFVAKEAKDDTERLGIKEPKNFEEKGISLVGEKLYTAFLKNYTEKQWNTKATNLSAEILSRIPVRFSHDNRYFKTAKHQGIPMRGYTAMVEKMLEGVDVRLNTDYLAIRDEIPEGVKVVYCGQVDELLDYELGVLPYRSLRFEVERTTDGLGEAVINEADKQVPYTRAHDYKYYQIHQPEVVGQEISIVAREYPADFVKGGEAYYPVNNEESEDLYLRYVDLLYTRYPEIILGGRLGVYRYWDMDVAVKNALELAKEIR